MNTFFWDVTAFWVLAVETHLCDTCHLLSSQIVPHSPVPNRPTSLLVSGW